MLLIWPLVQGRCLMSHLGCRLYAKDRPLVWVLAVTLSSCIHLGKWLNCHESLSVSNNNDDNNNNHNENWLKGYNAPASLGWLKLDTGAMGTKWDQRIKHLPWMRNLVIAEAIYPFIFLLSHDFLLGISSVFLAPLGIWHALNWDEPSALKSTVRVHHNLNSQIPIFLPSSWPICNSLVCFCGSWVQLASIHIPACVSENSGCIVDVWDLQDKELISSGYLWHFCPTTLYCSPHWSHQHRGPERREDWAKCTMYVNHRGQVNCLNVYSDWVVYKGRSVYTCFKPGSRLSQLHWLTLFTLTQ